MDVKLAGLMAEHAYDPNSVPAGWVLHGEEDVGYIEKGTAGAFRIYRNDLTREIVFAFKGTDNLAEFRSDILDSGRTIVANALVRAADRLAEIRSPDSEHRDYQAYTTGHSLGGAMAQTSALEMSLHPYFFNSLPLSLTRLQAYADDNFGGSVQLALAAYASQGKSAIGTYYGGEIADFKYRAVDGGLYRDSLMSDKTFGKVSSGLCHSPDGYVSYIFADYAKDELWASYGKLGEETIRKIKPGEISFDRGPSGSCRPWSERPKPPVKQRTEVWPLWPYQGYLDCNVPAAAVGTQYVKARYHKPDEEPGVELPFSC